MEEIDGVHTSSEVCSQLLQERQLCVSGGQIPLWLSLFFLVISSQIGKGLLGDACFLRRVCL